MSRFQHGWYSPEEKNKIVTEYYNSGLSLTNFSEKNNLKRSTLATWIRHYESANLIANTSFQDITPILKTENIAFNNNIKLTLPNGIILEFDSSILKKVVNDLK